MSAKSLGKILFFILFAVLLAVLVIYFARPDYPIRRVIKNTDGKTVDAQIIGKIADTVYLKRMPDETRFSLPLEKLAYKDRAFLTILRDEPPPVEAPTEKPEFSDSYIQNRIEQIEKLEEKHKIMQLELDSRTLNPIIEKEYRRRMASLDLEIRTLKVAIETHRYRLKKE